VTASLKRTVAELEAGGLAVATVSLDAHVALFPPGFAHYLQFQTQELLRLVKLLRLADERKEVSSNHSLVRSVLRAQLKSIRKISSSSRPNCTR
jgi:hypothetical protein